MKRLLVLLGVVWLLPVSGAFKLENIKGRAYHIVAEKSASLQEKEAAKILQNHLQRMMPKARFHIVETLPASNKGSILYVGNTRQLQKQKVNIKEFAREEFMIRETGNDLFLAGGHPRGCVYAVYEFLEQSGVLYASSDTIIIPRKMEIIWGKKPLRRKPAFKYRWASLYLYHKNAGKFKQFNKYNGHRGSSLATGSWEKYGGFPRTGGIHVHTLKVYSRTFPLNEPALFAQDADGKRMIPNRPGRGGPLCLSNPKVLELVWKQAKDAYYIFREKARKDNVPYPESYSISIDDDLRRCYCKACASITKEEGSYTGNVLRFVNAIARRFQKLDGKIRVTMIAYQQTLQLPKKVRPEKNVIPRICIQDREWKINVIAEIVNPIPHKNNAAFRKVFNEWKKYCPSLGIWEYWQYYVKGDFPYIALDAYFENLKFHKENNVENMLVQTSRIQHPFYDLKVFLALKLMDDPYRDRKKLIDSFMEAYYGKAAGVMSEYLYFLDGEVKKESALSPMGERPPKTYKYLNKAFFQKSYQLLARAEKLAGKNKRHLLHVQHEYVPLDKCLLNHWEQMGKYTQISRKALLARVEKNEKAMIEAKFQFPSQRKPHLARLESYILSKSILRPIPKEIKGEYIFDFNAHHMHENGANSKRVKDPDSPSGYAMRLSVKDGGEYINIRGRKHIYHKLPFTMGVYNWSERKLSPTKELVQKDIPQDEKYHLYKLGRWHLIQCSRLWAHWSWSFMILPTEAYTITPDYMSDIYISIKFTGPAYVKGSKKKNAVYIDRVIVAR